MSDPQRSFKNASEFTLKEINKANQVDQNFSLHSFQEIENDIIRICNKYYKKRQRKFKSLKQYNFPIYFFESVSNLCSATGHKFPLLHAFGNSQTYWKGQMTVHTAYEGMKHHDFSQGCVDRTTIGSLLYTQKNSKVVHVEWIDIVKPYQRQKLAAEMIKNFINFIKYKTPFSIITANCVNDASLNLFMSCGFKEMTQDSYLKRKGYNMCYMPNRAIGNN